MVPGSAEAIDLAADIAWLALNAAVDAALASRALPPAPTQVEQWTVRGPSLFDPPRAFEDPAAALLAAAERVASSKATEVVCPDGTVIVMMKRHWSTEIQLVRRL